MIKLVGEVLSCSKLKFKSCQQTHCVASYTLDFNLGILNLRSQKKMMISYLFSFIFSDKTAVMAASNLEFQWLVDRTSSQWTAGFNEDGVPKTGASIHLFNSDPWSSCLVEFLNPERLPTLCPSAILHSWPTGLP